MTRRAPQPYLPVEPLFDRVVERVGGCRVDSLFDEELAWENADYYFEQHGVVAELKEIATDQNDDVALQRKLGQILQRHKGKPSVPLVYGTAPVRIDLLPEETRREMILPFKRRLEDRVKKAARQIKATRIGLGVPSARGLLLLVNDASTFFTPEVTFHLLDHILRRQHTSIDQVVYCSVNMLVATPGAGATEGSRFWANAVVDDRNEIPLGFMQALSRAFVAVADEQTGVHGTWTNLAPDAVARMAFQRPDLAKDPEFFVQEKRFYKAPGGASYYCSEVSGGTATLYLLESWHEGQSIQAVFTQKLIYATRDRYTLVTDPIEKARLESLLREMRNCE